MNWLQLASVLLTVVTTGCGVAWFIAWKVAGCMTHAQHTAICEKQERERKELLEEIRDDFRDEASLNRGFRHGVADDLYTIFLSFAIIAMKLGIELPKREKRKDV